jgi:two-component system CheB/CheR fusion protein
MADDRGISRIEKLLAALSDTAIGAALAREVMALLADLAASEQRYRSLFETNPDGIFAVDPAGKFILANPACEALSGYSAAELLSRTFMDLCAPDRLPDTVAAFNRRDAGGVQNLDTALIRKDGRRVELLLSGGPVVVDGEVAAVHCVAKDVTGMKLAEGRLQAIIEALAEGLVVSDMDGRVLQWNRAAWEMHDLPADADYRQPIAAFETLFELTAADGGPPLPMADWPLARILRGERVRDLEVRIRRRDAAWERVFSYGGTLVPGPDGHPQWAVLTFNDVTARKAAEAAARRAADDAEAASNAKDHFLAVLSHELRTPLTPVLATAQMLAADPALSPAHRELIQMIQRNAQLEARLIDDLLDLTRITRGKLEVQRQPVDLHEKIGHVVAMVARDIEAKRLGLFVELAAARCMVEGDPARLQQIVWNLLTNAVKFTPAAGTVRVETRNAGGRVELVVADTGVGIAADLLPRVFDAFEQGGPATTRQFGGLGLGLAISKVLVETHGGTIAAASPGPGGGATFTVALPATAAAPPAPAQARRPAEAVPAPWACRILVVEDHPDTRGTLVRLLTIHGATVSAAATVAEAAAAADAAPFDLLLSDIGLPDGSGLDVIRLVRAKQPAVAAIALSGYGMEDDVARSKAAGFDTHLIKPVDLRLLLEAIETLVKKR